MSTPNIEADVIDRLVTLRPLLFQASTGPRNTWPGLEHPVGGLIANDATFIRAFAERTRIHSGGQWREVDVQILRRFGRGSERLQHAAGLYARALDDARDVYDALHLSGAFTGASGANYLEVRAIGGPDFLEPCYFSLNFSFWLDA